MATTSEILIKVKADTKAAVAGVAKVDKGLKKLTAKEKQAARSGKAWSASLIKVGKSAGLMGKELIGAAKGADKATKRLRELKNVRLKEQLDKAARAAGRLEKKTRDAGRAARGASSMFKRLGVAILGVLAVRQVIRGIGAFVTAAREQEDAIVRIRVALEKQGVATEENVESMTAWASALARTIPATQTQILGAQALALNMGLSAAKADTLALAATDMAAALGVDVNMAARQLSITLGGMSGELGERVAEVRDLTIEERRAGKAIDVVAEKFRGAARAAGQTLSGQLSILRGKLDETMAGMFTAATGGDSMTEAIDNITNALINMTPMLLIAAEKVGVLGKKVLDFFSSLQFLGADAESGFVGTLTGNAFEAEVQLGFMEAKLVDARRELERIGDLQLGTGVDIGLSGAGAGDTVTAEKKLALLVEQRAEIGRQEKGLVAQEAVIKRLNALVEETGAHRGDGVNVMTEEEEIQERIRKLTAEIRKGLAGAVTARQKGAEAGKREAESITQVLEAMSGLNLETDKELDLLDTLKERAEKSLSSVETGFIAGTASAQDLSAATQQLAVDLAAISDAALGASLAGARGESSQIELGGGEPTRQGIGAQGGVGRFGDEGGGGVDLFGAQDFLGMMLRPEQRDMAQEALAAITEGTEGYATVVERLTAAFGALSPAMMAAAKSSQVQQAKTQAMVKVQGMLFGALKQTAAAFIKQALTGKIALRELAKEALTSLAAEAGSQAIFELAMGLAAAARHDPAAVQHFAAAKLFGLVAGVAAAGALALGSASGGEEGGGTAGASAGGGGGDTDTFDATEEEVEDRGRSVTIIVEGNIVDHEAFARELGRFGLFLEGEEEGSLERRG